MLEFDALRERLEALVERVKDLLETESPQGKTKDRVAELVRVAFDNTSALDGLLDLIVYALMTPERAQRSEATGTDFITDLMKRSSGDLKLPVIDLDALDLDSGVVRMVRREVAVKHQLVAFGLHREPSGEILLKVAMADPTNIFAREDVKFATGNEIKIYVASEDAIARAIEKYYERPDPERA